MALIDEATPAIVDAAGPGPAWCEGVALWLVRLDAWPGEERQRCLSEEEIQRSGRFRFEDDRRRYVAAHVALREHMAGFLGCAPADLVFRKGLHGKPGLVSADLHFNLSHSGDLALIGLSRREEIGVDLEVLREVDDAQALAEVVFGMHERQTLGALAGAARDRAFLQGWTRKEACLKALGTGLSLSPQVFEAGLDDAAAEVAVPMSARSERLAVCSLMGGKEAGTQTPWVGAVARRLRPA